MVEKQIFPSTVPIKIKVKKKRREILKKKYGSRR
jgi:hypothetical protein